MVGVASKLEMLKTTQEVIKQEKLLYLTMRKCIELVTKRIFGMGRDPDEAYSSVPA